MARKIKLNNQNEAVFRSKTGQTKVITKTWKILLNWERLS